MTSLRVRLFAILLLATGLIWLSAVAWIYLGSKREVEQVLDTRLQEAARMVGSLVGAVGGTTSDGTPSTFPGPTAYERQLSCQIWSLDGRMVARSSGAPERRLTDAPAGFSEREVDGETWRVFTVEDAEKGVRVMVGDRLGLRERLVTDLIMGLVTPALLVVPFLGMLIWASLGRGLRPLRLMARDLAGRDADDMSAIDAGRTPAEVRPLADALNGLFLKVEAARRHEREVTAFAAHELRTPLAGLKTQAQVAMATTDPDVAKAALRQILAAVDRTTRLVRQLLDAARLDAAGESPTLAEVDVGALVAETVDGMRMPAGVRTLIDPGLRGYTLRADAESLRLAVRNLHENAVHHMDAGTVEWLARPDGEGMLVRDEGPGIPAEELPHVTTRFFRGRHKSATGSGLGLAIAEMASRRSGLSLRLRNRPDRPGLEVEILRA
ncbi:two-component system sensor histidine kinase QseC [Methylobacterium sp. PvP062]|jgi:two-component system, OmpR family, sensor histidine kinase QseC|uniref:histidine kinase n=2 Tax=Methylobacterium TaxID=407 RepID=A0A509E9T7_9HYPH|nr:MULTISPECIES: ATP-binding protein [Methylobacterium]MCX7333314.1 sensor histidine kinase N-terminal domain-containing protein [Hyphomicrobiales bacterium]GAN46041.1 integral membrane sensor signal transduction histidine kinase [Methylobacterium sp. ME121]MBN6818448.1 sensor histidine kinase N-terminal domain-containing protein [Methylobacterium organophilum]MBP2492864.1 two-component system sensor histidine kinase QseC [Methylobacterium sp. PvP105]MBP2500764.1 two-component system sensor hi